MAAPEATQVSGSTEVSGSMPVTRATRLRTIGMRLESSAALASARAIENRAERGAKMQNIDYEEVLRERMIVGTPGRVIDRLAQLREELGLDGVLAELNPGSLIPHARVMTALRLLCEEVMPRFK